MRLLNDSVITFSDNRDDLRTIEIEFSGDIKNEYVASQVLVNLDYDYGDMATSEDIVIVYDNYGKRFYTNGFDLLCFLKSHTRRRY